MEDFKSNLEVQNKQLVKDLKATKDHESDLNKKYESLKKKHEADCLNFQNSKENDKVLNE